MCLFNPLSVELGAFWPQNTGPAPTHGLNLLFTGFYLLNPPFCLSKRGGPEVFFSTHIRCVPLPGLIFGPTRLKGE